MKKHIFFIICIFLFSNCDPGGHLLIKDNSVKNKTIQLDECSLKFSLRTLMNTEFSLNVEIKTEKVISIFTDSLNIFHNNERVDYQIYYHNNAYQTKTIKIIPGNDDIFYSFELDPKRVNKGDTISLFAKNFIRKDTNSFDIDEIKFIVSRTYL